MKLSLLTWNSVNINNGSPYSASIVSGQLGSISRNPVLVNRAGDYPALTAVVKNPSVLVINVIVSAGQNINTYREALKAHFFGDDLRHDIIAKDTNDSDRQYYRTGIPVTMVEENGAPNSFFITIQTEYPYWQLVTAATATWNITGSAQTNAVTNAGNLPIAPVFTITPTTTKTTGWKYWRWVPIYNRTDKTYTAPMEITDGGLDAAALIGAGKMMTDGSDFRVWMDGGFAGRWLHGMPSTNALCWTNITLGPHVSGLTGATLGNTATTMSLSETRANLAFLQALKTTANYTLLVGSEAITFDPDDIDLINYQVTGLGRGKKNTTAATHSSGSTVHYIDHDLFIMYANTAATAQDVDDQYKPMFDLSSSNETWSWTNYSDLTGNRPGAWRGDVVSSRTRLSYTYTANENTFADPSTVMGLAERGSQDFTVPHEAAQLTWSFSHPAGITTAAYSGKKYRTGSWPGIAGLQKLQAGAVWVTVSNQTTPSTATVWEPFGPTTSGLSGSYTSIRFVMEGVLSSAINESAMLQFSGVSANFSTASLPVISVGAETAINFFDFKLTNITTGEWLKVRTPCPVNSDLVIDCAARTAYLADGRPVTVTLSSERADWLNLAAGSNTLQFDDVGTVAVTIATAHRDKVL